MRKEQKEKLKNNELTADELYKNELAWNTLEKVEALYDESDIGQMIENAKKRGYFEKNEITKK